MNKIRVKTDMADLLEAGQRSAWTRCCPSVGWLIINSGATMAVVTTQCENKETGCLSDC